MYTCETLVILWVEYHVMMAAAVVVMCNGISFQCILNEEFFSRLSYLMPFPLLHLPPKPHTKLLHDIRRKMDASLRIPILGGDIGKNYMCAHIKLCLFCAA